MKISSATLIGEMDVYDLALTHPDHSFVHSSGVVVHNSGFVICNEPVKNFIPLTTVSEVKVTQYDMRTVEAVGGVKMDYLSVKSLIDIQDCISLVRQRHAPEIDPKADYTLSGKRVPGFRMVPGPHDVWALPDDPEVYRDICRGDTESVFQFGTEFAQGWLRLFKPKGDGTLPLKSISDLATFTALDRPGPLDYKVEGKHNMLVEYAHRSMGLGRLGELPILNELFPETHGIIVFQEQIQKAFQTIGGTTGIQANAFREHIAKKKMELVFKDKELFLPGATERLGKEVAEELWKSMETFGQYSFNKSHSVCYSVIGYACAYLKHHYPLEWWAAVLSNASKAKVYEKFWHVCGHMIDLPDINKSTDAFTIDGDRLLAPVNLILGIGEQAHKQLCETRPYSDIQDFTDKIAAWSASGKRNALTNGVVPNMIVTGVMDALFLPDSTLMDKFMAYQQALAKSNGQKKTKRIPKCEILSQANVYQRYQITKRLMPEFSSSLIKMMSERGEPGISKDDYGYRYTNELEGRVKTLRVADLSEVDKAIAGGVFPEGGLKLAVAAYVQEDRRFKYGEGKKKEAASLKVDVEGVTYEFVKWPPRTGNKLPESWKESMTGSIVILALEKFRQEKPFAVLEAFVVQPPYNEKEEEDERSC